MGVRVLQAVLREAEAVAHCHRVQVGAKREQVCMRDPRLTDALNCGNTVNKKKQTRREKEKTSVTLVFYPPKISLQL